MSQTNEKSDEFGLTRLTKLLDLYTIGLYIRKLSLYGYCIVVNNDDQNLTGKIFYMSFYMVHIYNVRRKKDPLQNLQYLQNFA